MAGVSVPNKEIDKLRKDSLQKKKSAETAKEKIPNGYSAVKPKTSSSLIPNGTVTLSNPSSGKPVTGV